MPNPEVPNSSYLDFTGYRIASQSTVATAYNLDPTKVEQLTGSDPVGLNVAIVLPRVTDPTSLLLQNWGARQQALAGYNSTTLWDTFGTDPTAFKTVKDDIKALGLNVLDNSNSDYVTSAASQTIWVEINTAKQFKDLFGTDIYESSRSSSGFDFWNGNLTLPAAWNVQGLWFDTENNPPASNFVGNASVTLPQGPQGIGNSSPSQPALPPQNIAAVYNYPLLGQSFPTGPIGLLEPGIGDALPTQTPTFQQLLGQYLASIGETGTGTVFVQGQDGQEVTTHDERSLDVGVVSSVNPGSNIWLYGGSGYNGNADATVYTALQSAVYYSVPGQQMPAVFSNSFGDDEEMAPNSPFYYAYSQLFVDAALANQTIFDALGDGGSGNETANGLTNIEYNVTSAYGVLVGGTSISNFVSAQTDPTLDSSFVANALAGNLATIWQLVAGGLTVLPQDTAQLQDFIETVWNQYFVSGSRIANGGYQTNQASSGGVDPTQPVPTYQQNYGLNPVTSDPLAQTGRGAPDVAADAGGNTNYLVPTVNMVGTNSNGGTSAASPLWASLAVQINAIFNDQGLPNLGYMNDLLYIAAAIAPAAFNDITVGSNTSSFVKGGSYESNGVLITPTGFGYSAGTTYDQVSGLGTPDGMLLARTLSQIAHSEMFFPNQPAVIDSDRAGGWTSGAKQSLLFQATGSSTSIDLLTGSQTTSLSGPASASYAWTARLAEQSLQSDFDPNIVLMFDEYAQGALTELNVGAGSQLGVSVNGSSASPTQVNLTAAFGFAGFNAPAGSVNVARAVIVAETPLGASNQQAVVRMRSDGQDSLAIEFYRVDDMQGTVAGLMPGDPRYAEAADGRAYSTMTGQTLINGPGYGGFQQLLLQGVNKGDLIAMKLVDTTHGSTFWEFAQANEQVGGQGVTHVVNYGLNTFGWEDTLGAGDRDYNDLVVGVDFTSASGHQLLVS